MALEYVYILKDKAKAAAESAGVDKSFYTKDTVADFGVYCSGIPFTMMTDVKDVYSNDWVDEDGVDEYTPESEGLKFKSYDVEIEWSVKGEENTCNTKIRSFLDFLSGKDGTGVMMSMYCTWTKIGRQNMRLVKIAENATFVRDADNGDIIVFKTTFRVGDPVTDVALRVNHLPSADTGEEAELGE